MRDIGGREGGEEVWDYVVIAVLRRDGEVDGELGGDMPRREGEGGGDGGGGGGEGGGGW